MTLLSGVLVNLYRDTRVIAELEKIDPFPQVKGGGTFVNRTAVHRLPKQVPDAQHPG